MNKLFFKWLKEFFQAPDKYAHLKQFRLLQGLSGFELYLLNNCMHKRSYRAGEMIYDKDYPLETLFLIVSGEIEIGGRDGSFESKVLSANDFLGLIDMYHEAVRSSSAKAKTAVEALAISKGDLQDLIKQNPSLGIKFLSNACGFFSEYIVTLRSRQEQACNNDIVGTRS